jgi:N-acetylglucosaminyl-diphospho-decaprenol L-rhamnosyltransferase
MSADLTSVVVHYGPAEPTIRVSSSALVYSTSVVVVANDRSPRPAELDSRIIWLIPPRNLGFGDGFTLGARHRPAKIFLVLNNDVIVGEDSVRACIEAFSDEGIGVVGPVLRYEDGSLQSGAGTLSKVICASRTKNDPGIEGTDCVWVTGAVMFVRESTLYDVGMDGSYFLGYEDADFCIRARSQGWRVRCVGSAPAIHFSSRVISGPRWSYYAARNHVWFVRARYGRTRAFATWVRGVALLPRVIFSDLVKRHDMTSSRLMVLGLRHALLPKPSASEGPWKDEPIPSGMMKW